MASTKDYTYISKTNPDPYAQIIVLSQNVINDSFENMWHLAQLDDDSPLKHFKQSFRSGDKLESDIGIPSVQLQVTTKDPMLYFMLRMSDGSLFLYLSEDENDDSHIDWAIKDWVFAFSVTIARKEITKDSPEYAEFKDRAGLSESNFTLAQLFIDASSTTKWNPELSNFGDKEEDFKNLTPEARSSFDTMIQKWLNLMHEKGCNILGYQAKREDNEDDELNQYAPSFPPTSIDYFCYPWRGPEGSENEEDNRDENGLSYLLMSNFDKPPGSGAIDYTGAWVDGKDRGAIFSMNRALFWDWMLPVLRQVVIGMVPYPDKPYCQWDGTDPDLPYQSGMNYHAGDNDAPDNLYRFVKLGPNFWTAQGRELHSEASAKNPHDANDHMNLTQNTKDDYTTLSYNPGTEQIELRGSSTFIFRADHYSSGHTYTLMTFYITWSVSLAMASVDDGGLVFKKGPDNVDVSHAQEGGMHWSDSPESIASDWADMLKDNMKGSFSSIENHLLYALANQHRLNLPAKGSFLMKDPLFNDNGDLLVSLTYNGADPPRPRKRKLC